MSAYQFLNPAPLFFNIPGTDPLSDGGNLYFYDEGTTNPRDTWSDPALDVPHLNPNPVPLDASGRSTVAIWLDGSYSVELRDSNDDLVWSRDVRSDVAPGLSIPALVADFFLSNDGSNLAWVDPIGAIFPDPTGSVDYILSTDGNNIFWIPQPEIPEPEQPEIVVTAASVLTAFQAGTSEDETKFFAQFGTGSAPASNAKTTSLAVVFTTPFATLPYVMVSNTTGYVNGGDTQPTVAAVGVSTTGFTAQFSTQLGEGNPDSNIVVAVNFGYAAFGTREVAP